MRLRIGLVRGRAAGPLAAFCLLLALALGELSGAARAHTAAGGGAAVLPALALQRSGARVGWTVGVYRVPPRLGRPARPLPPQRSPRTSVQTAACIGMWRAGPRSTVAARRPTMPAGGAACLALRTTRCGLADLTALTLFEMRAAR